jgi:hypothetical protein
MLVFGLSPPFSFISSLPPTEAHDSNFTLQNSHITIQQIKSSPKKFFHKRKCDSSRVYEGQFSVLWVILHQVG